MIGGTTLSLQYKQVPLGTTMCPNGGVVVVEEEEENLEEEEVVDASKNKSSSNLTSFFGLIRQCPL